jgi:GAF domain-containing protein
LSELLREATGLVGADVAAFMSFINDGQCESFRYLLACDPQWLVDYEQRAWYADDPWIAYAKQHSRPIRASEIAPSGPVQAEIVRLAEEYGFRSTAIVPAPSSGGLSRLGMLCLGSRTPGYFEQRGLAPSRWSPGPWRPLCWKGASGVRETS